MGAGRALLPLSLSLSRERGLGGEVISVVIRTKNEEQWIGRCLAAVTSQTGLPREIILVDNDSRDKTLEVASRFPCRILHISDEEFSFGRALNQGIAATTGELVAILSGHCIPLHDQWLQCLSSPFEDPNVAGVYGGQDPLPDTDPFDKRDLWTTFGTERRVQRKDYFFHNGNSMVRRDVWQRLPFDEELQGVEDRDWARAVLARGYSLVYTPHARVHHYHGIHHGHDARRAERVVQVIDLIHKRGGGR
jgi:glycosyltransferase involved in cell wall biosynthesis